MYKDRHLRALSYQPENAPTLIAYISTYVCAWRIRIVIITDISLFFFFLFACLLANSRSVCMYIYFGHLFVDSVVKYTQLFN